MARKNIAVVGMGKVGAKFLHALLSRKESGINLVCVAEEKDTVGRREAIRSGVCLKTIAEIITMGHDIDIIFDLTGNKSIRRHMRDELARTQNQHTVIAPENVAHVIWSLITDQSFTGMDRNEGY